MYYLIVSKLNSNFVNVRHILHMAPAALLQDRAGAGPNDSTSSRFLELIVHMLLYV